MQNHYWLPLWLLFVWILAGAHVVRAQESGGPVVLKEPGEAKLVRSPGVPDCITSTALRSAPGGGPTIVLARLSAGCAVPWHWHTPSESLMVVRGTLQLQMKGESSPSLLRSGGFASMPSHHIHRALCPHSCEMYVIYSEGSFDIHYVDESGKELSLDQALKPKGAQAGR